MPRRRGKDAETGGRGTQRELNTDEAAVSRNRPNDTEKRQKRGRSSRVDPTSERVIHRGERY